MDFGRYIWRRPASTSRTGKQDRPIQYSSDSGMYTRNYYYRDCPTSVIRCFKCQQKGHIAKYCQAHIKNVVKKNKCKSEKKRDRDLRRRMEFIARKSACAAMPFNDISDDELVAFMPKFTIMQNQKKMLSVNTVQNTASETSKLEVEKSLLTTEVDCLKTDKQNLERKVSEKEDEIVSLKEKIEEQTKDMETLQRRIKDKEFVVKFLEEQFRFYRAETERLEKALEDKNRMHQQPQQQYLEAKSPFQQMEINLASANTIDQQSQLEELGVMMQQMKTDLIKLNNQNETSQLQEQPRNHHRNNYNGRDNGHPPSRRYNRRR